MASLDLCHEKTEWMRVEGEKKVFRRGDWVLRRERLWVS